MSRFKSAEAEANFLAAYQRCLALWPIAHNSQAISTSFGLTHINSAGSANLPPLVLLHGAQMSSPIWYANIAALSQHFRVYAPDVIDQMGLSQPTRKLKSHQDYADWLSEVLDALHIETVSLIGHSQGGWEALNMAIRNPQRIERLVLLAPAPAFVQLRFQVLLRMLPVFLRPTKAMFYWNFQWMTTMPLGDDNPIVEQFMIGAQSFKPDELSFGASSVFSDAELAQIKMPCLLLIGEHEVVYKPQKAIERAKSLIPQIETELITGGGHLFQVDQADATNARILKFLLAQSERVNHE